MYYIAGPMTGLPDFNYPLFEKVAQRLRDQGFEVRSPHEHFKDIEHTPGEHPWYYYMTLGIKLLVECTDIVMLENWWNSRGARFERHIAQELDMQIWTYNHQQDELKLVMAGGRPEHG